MNHFVFLDVSNLYSAFVIVKGRGKIIDSYKLLRATSNHLDIPNIQVNDNNAPSYLEIYDNRYPTVISKENSCSAKKAICLWSMLKVKVKALQYFYFHLVSVFNRIMKLVSHPVQISTQRLRFVTNKEILEQNI